MRKLFACLAVVMLASCAGGFQQFYNPFVDARKLSNVQLLGSNEDPAIYSTNDMKRDVLAARSKGYIPIGYASFNGAMGTRSQVVQQARNVGAVMVLVSSQYTGTRQITTPLFVPNNQTTYYNSITTGQTNGSVYSGYGSANYSGNFNGMTSGTATTYGTTVVPMTTYQQRYDQSAVFFVKSTIKPRFGLFINDLTPELRDKYQRNTGVLVVAIAEESPAFIANILPGDLIIEISGTQVVDAKQATELLKSVLPNGGSCPLKIIRDGTEKTIAVQVSSVK